MRAFAWALLALVLLAPVIPAQSAPVAGCAAGVGARAHGDGGVLVTWGAPSEGVVRIVRAAGAGEWSEIARVDAAELKFNDETARPGVTYRYAALVGEGDASCPVVEVSVMPYRDGVKTALGITVAAVAGYLVVRAGAWGTRSGPARVAGGLPRVRARKTE